jgi:hypothetical protein
MLDPLELLRRPRLAGRLARARLLVTTVIHED